MMGKVMSYICRKLGIRTNSRTQIEAAGTKDGNSEQSDTSVPVHEPNSPVDRTDAQKKDDNGSHSSFKNVRENVKTAESDIQECNNSFHPGPETLSDQDEKRKAIQSLKEELRSQPQIITRGVEQIVETVEDAAVIRLEDLDKDLQAFEKNFENNLHSLAKKTVCEAAKTMFVTLRDTKEVKEIERWYRHHTLDRDEDGTMYAVEINFVVSGQRSPGPTSYFSSSDKAAYPEMIVAYRILVNRMKGPGNTEDVPDNSELKLLTF